MENCYILHQTLSGIFNSCFTYSVMLKPCMKIQIKKCDQKYDITNFLYPTLNAPEPQNSSYKRMLNERFVPFISDQFHDLEVPGECGMIFQVGTFSSIGVSGSSYVEMCGSSIACKFLSLRNVNKHRSCGNQMDNGYFECEVTYSKHITALGSHQCDNDDITRLRRISQLVQDAIQPSLYLDKYPKQLLSLSIVVLKSSSFDLCACINAASLALADALVEMRDLPCAFAIHHLNREKYPEKMSYDENIEELKVTLCILPNLGLSSLVQTEGRSSNEIVDACIDSLVSKCDQIRNLMSTNLLKRSMNF